MPPGQTLSDALVYRARTTSDQNAIYFISPQEELSSLTYAELLASSQRVAWGLRDRGVGRGDTVLICSDTSPQLLSSFLGCVLLGAVPVLASPPTGLARLPAWGRAIAHMVRTAGCRTAVLDDRLYDLIDAVREQLGIIAVLTPSDFLLGAAPILPSYVGSEDLAFIQFTSGTTAEPKGVMVTHRSLLANIRCIAETSRWTTDELGMGWLPLHHDMGLVGITLAPLVCGFPVVLMSPQMFLLRPSRWFWAMHYFRATATAAPNFAYALCADRIKDPEIEGLDLSHWRHAYNGAEPIHPETIRQFVARFGKFGFTSSSMRPVYGLAETTLAATFSPAGAEPHYDVIQRAQFLSTGHAVHAPAEGSDVLTFVSVGHSFPGHELRVVDKSGHELPERRQGQIILRGPSLSAGYVNDPDATAATFRDGWMWTSDLGYLAGGQLFVCSRIDDVIVKAGSKYCPYELEYAAARVLGVRPGNVAAFGVPNAQSGTEDLVLVFESRMNDSTSRQELAREVERKVFRAVGIRPDDVVPLGPHSLPKTSSGKIRRAKLKELYLSTRRTVGVGAQDII
jgi:acyl-CoA synthetase (AMP-forming)/AMP-acid ligase II